MGSISQPKNGSIEYAAFKGSATGKITKASITRGPLEPHEVQVKILYSGLCGTDEHMRHNDQVLGHEGVGEIIEVGDRVTEFSV